MEILSASDGGSITLDRGLAEYETYEQLLIDISEITGVPLDNVLIFLEDGRELKADVLEQIWERGGEGSASEAQQVLYLFNKETFWLDPEVSAARCQEEIQLPPTLPLMAIQDVDMVQHPFILASDHIQHLQSLFAAQANALSIAYSNLHSYLLPFISEFEGFAPRAEASLDNEKDLINSAKGDMAMLSKIEVHEALYRKKERDKDGTRKTMADWVNIQKMEQVQESCRNDYNIHEQKYATLASQVEDLKAHSDAETRSARERSAALALEFDEALKRIDVALNHVETLVVSRVEGAIQDLAELDRAMRDDLVALTNLKNDFTLELHIHLRQIAQFQTQVAQLAPMIHAIETDLSNKTAFPHLNRLKHLPFAYAASVVEVVRRKEYGVFLNDWISRLREALARFIKVENDRRLKMKEDVLSHLPFSTTGMDESTSVGVEISVFSGSEALRGINLDRKDVDTLLQWMEGLEKDRDLLDAIRDSNPHLLDILRMELSDLVGKMDVSGATLDRYVEQSVLRSSSSQLASSQSLSVHLRAVEKEKVEQAKQLVELQAKYELRVKELEAGGDSRTTALQARQAELQEELVRLRSDLSDEMQARQALSTQLDENAREADEKQNDNNELITSLQAELAQEKDRATDLGVRLQEALLDIDGMRNAEQTLLTQVQQLQEERSRSLSQVSEVQNQSRNLESQLAGLRAELESTNAQLSQARVERDTALKNQSAEAERMMRDHIAEADGDRAVLEHQNLALAKQLEDMQIEMSEKLSVAKNSAIRHADGLKAELQFTKAQLRDSQRRETVLADELAMAKDTASQMTQQTSHQSDVSKDAVALAMKYYETCQRLLTTINSSSTINGPTAKTTTVSASVALSSSSKDEMKESALVKSLGVAQAFDLSAFSDAVQKTVSIVKKWSKTCKTYRELARNRIAFNNFSKGDLALFLPTRGPIVKSWACFNVSAPHNFLKLDPTLEQQIATKEYLIARISKTEEATATGGDSPETNPFGLANGLRYWVHTVEEYTYNPATAVRPPKRSISTSFYGRPQDDGTASQITPRRPGHGRANTIEGTSIFTPSPEKDSYFPDQARPSSPPLSARAPEQIEQEEDSSQSGQTPQLSQSPPDEVIIPLKPNDADARRLSPVAESLSISSRQLSNPPSTAVAVSPPRALQTLPDAKPLSDGQKAQPRNIEGSQASRPPSRAHYRAPSRLSSPPSRDLPPPFFPSSLGRPSSVASSSSSYPHGGPFATTKAAPAMAITTSNGSGKNEIPDPFKNTIARRKSSTYSLKEEAARTSGTRPSPLGSPDFAIASPDSSGFQSLGTGTSPVHITQSAGNAPSAPSPGNSPGMAASRLIRGFSIRKRKESTVGTSEKPSAMDMLKRFDGSGT